MACPTSVDEVAVLFDFDGTVGDTETPAMKVAFWEIAPYLPGIASEDLPSKLPEYVRNNAGKAFEMMVEACDADRKAAGLGTAEELRASQKESEKDIAVVDKYRQEFGLKTFAELRAEGGGNYPTLLQQQKIETVEALSRVARPCPGIPEVLKTLTDKKVPFCISTTSPKPRVPASITACGLDEYFPAAKVHSGESDFDPPRFKPNPSVYLKAAETEGKPPCDCIAVEDSGSGVGSAANAKVGLIVGYVGASHITDDKADEHAKMLMSGDRSEDKRGAECVISDMTDLVAVVDAFLEHRKKGGATPFSPAKELLKSMKQPVWTGGCMLE